MQTIQSNFITVINPDGSIVSKGPNYRPICREAGEVLENLKKELSKDYADRIE